MQDVHLQPTPTLHASLQLVGEHRETETNLKQLRTLKEQTIFSAALHCAKQLTLFANSTISFKLDYEKGRNVFTI